MSIWPREHVIRIVPHPQPDLTPFEAYCLAAYNVADGFLMRYRPEPIEDILNKMDTPTLRNHVKVYEVERRKWIGQNDLHQRQIWP